MTHTVRSRIERVHRTCAGQADAQKELASLGGRLPAEPYCLERVCSWRLRLPSVFTSLISPSEPLYWRGTSRLPPGRRCRWNAYLDGL